MKKHSRSEINDVKEMLMINHHVKSYFFTDKKITCYHLTFDFEGQNISQVGIATCGKNDTFDFDRGRKIALGRAYHQMAWRHEIRIQSSANDSEYRLCPHAIGLCRHRDP